MKYYRFRIKTTTEAEDVIISAMEEVGLVGAQIEDHVPLSASEKEQQYIYEGAEPDTVIPDDGIAYLSFYLSEEELTEVGDTGDGSVLSPESAETGTLSHFSSSGEQPEVTGGLSHLSPASQGDRGTVPSVTSIEDSIHTTLAALRPHTNLGDATVTVDIMDDADWQDNWKQFFHKFYIDDILILPSWEEEPDATTSSQYTLRIDPGTAFGTGAHETTQLCIRALRKHLQEGDRILDVGTGSGVLSILALMFGASYAVGTDLDPQVQTAIADNLKRNHIPEDCFKLVMGNLIDDEKVQAEVGERYDLILANILPAVLVPLAPVIPRFLKEGGTYITSGILTERIPEVTAAIENAGLTIIETTTQGEWNSIVARNSARFESYSLLYDSK